MEQADDYVKVMLNMHILLSFGRKCLCVGFCYSYSAASYVAV
jgi:hypothetical protein